MNEAVYSMLPVNKTAAVVTSQRGCSDKPTVEQQLENLKLRAKQLQMAFIEKSYRNETERQARGKRHG
jgi:Ni2+-binding GTPase involved in maturation of urease and hydrogenase